MSQAAPAAQARSTVPTLVQRPRKKSRRTMFIVIAVVLVLAIAIAAAVAKNRMSSKATAVTVEKASIRSVTQYVTATGKIQPEVEVKITPEVSGEIIELPFREGAQVKKGDLLVRFKSDNYRYQLDQREADLAASRANAVQIKAQLEKAESDFKRTSGLFEKTLLPESEFVSVKTAVDVARANYDNALAQIRRAEGLLKQSQDLLEKTTIYSPMDGTVSVLKTEVGERVAATGQFNAIEVMRVADLTNMELRVEVNENDVTNVKLRDKAKVNIDAFPNRTFTGEVTEIASTATTLGANTQEQVTNFEVKIRILDRDQPLKPGMSGIADIATKTAENVVAVPIQSVTVRSKEGSKTVEQLSADREKSATQNKGEGSAAAVNLKDQREKERSDRDSLQRVVYVLDGTKVKQVLVETGIADTTHMEIKSGVKEGEQVVSGSFATITRVLKDGMEVKVDTGKPAKK
jgi:HlyD family secretion protein